MFENPSIAMFGSPVFPRVSGMPLKPKPAGVVSVTHGKRSSLIRLNPIRTSFTRLAPSTCVCPIATLCDIWSLIAC
jgi:hypothetical protein